jgi:alanyl-tRNA synthetase
MNAIRSGNEIRELFLRFFESKGHRRVHSSSLVPANDPTLLFTNAGMNQFKDLFLGAEKRDYSRATTSQKCVRAGGKHNDLENVGFTRRHHTFFEMLGNFSFGDYFKREAIAFAWELVTSEEWFGIPKDRLYVTIFEGAPTACRATTRPRATGSKPACPRSASSSTASRTTSGRWARPAPAARARRSSTTWASKPPRHPGVDKPFGHDDARYVEIWNLVFMQFDRSAIVDPRHQDTTYKLTPLPKPSIDTGMGLERVAAVLQGKNQQLRNGSVHAADRARRRTHGSRRKPGRNQEQTPGVDAGTPACASSPTTPAPPPSSSTTACCLRTKAAATCCARFCAAAFATAACSARSSRFSSRWSTPSAIDEGRVPGAD